MIKGHLHPITQFLRLATDFFNAQGFEIVEGNEIETEKYNFDLLNVPKDHPSRDIQDTFWLENRKLLRTHTSAMQIRAMENHNPPVRIIVPGRCFRHEATDATHETTFYQLEGFAIDKNIQMSHLVGTLESFLKYIFGKKIKIRIRPHFYPFVEPGMDVDMEFKGKWKEVLGSGMIHPNVLKNMGVDPQKFQGFAFGLGIDRLMMMYFGINDIRLSYSGDLKFLKQF